MFDGITEEDMLALPPPDPLIHLRTTPFYGNHYADRDLTASCHKVASDSKRPLAERLEALAKLNEKSGTNSPVDEEALEEYLEIMAMDG